LRTSRSRFPGSGKLPNLDRAYSALITDLRERGLLESTLVVLMGEFGRTPKLNALGGRDHWPRAGCVCLAGGGVKGGQVIGATNSFGEVPVERPVGPPDLAFTILRLLGVDPSKEFTTSSGRPVKILGEGSFISELV
jgi:arylsulfatase A-like enzyme